VWSFETAERDGEGMAFKIRLERGDFPVVFMPQITYTKWKKILEMYSKADADSDSLSLLSKLEAQSHLARIPASVKS